MLNGFFGLNVHLTENTACLGYENSFFSHRAHLTENTACINYENCFFGLNATSQRTPHVSIMKTVSSATGRTSQRTQSHDQHHSDKAYVHGPSSKEPIMFVLF